MKELTRLKLYLNISTQDTSNDELLTVMLEDSFEEVAAYTNRDVSYIKGSAVGVSAAIKLTVINYNNRGFEGYAAAKAGNSTLTFTDTLTKEIKTQLSSLRRAKIR